MTFIPRLTALLKAALREDIGRRDVTTESIIPKDEWAECRIVAKGTGILSGGPLIPIVFRLLNRRIRVRLLVRDGAGIRKGARVAVITGPLRPILTGERVTINFLGHLSGISTLTRKFVRRTQPYHVLLFDTRKTIPLLRVFEKYAVRCGGGRNHRLKLEEAIFIKKNHLMGIRYDWERLKKTIHRRGNKALIIEVDRLKLLRYAASLAPDLILLDNMSPGHVKRACDWIRRRNLLISANGKIELEASGGIKLQNVRNYAKTGVRRISVGALTHSAASVDFSLEVRKVVRRRPSAGSRGGFGR